MPFLATRSLLDGSPSHSHLHNLFSFITAMNTCKIYIHGWRATGEVRYVVGQEGKGGKRVIWMLYVEICLGGTSRLLHLQRLGFQ